MFRTELHCHSLDISECARVNNADIVKKFSEAGCSTLVLTNHFNTGTMRFNKATSWEDFINKFFEAYENLKKEACGKLNILIGAELRFDENYNDYLVYGFTKDDLLGMPDIFKMTPESFSKISREKGFLFIQAHPFRNGMTVVRPIFLDGVEVFNGHFGHDSRNEIAESWAEKFGLIKTSGTDFHYNDSPANAGILTDVEITSIDQLIETLKSGSYQLVKGN